MSVPHAVRSVHSGPGPAAFRGGRRPLGIDELLAAARAGLERIGPHEAALAAAHDAVIVDIRPEANRRAEGTIPGALQIDRNVLEWRLDPSSEAALPIADHDLRVILVCNEGYQSSLAAATLQELGIWRATDLIGGYRAWQAAGLSTVPGAA